NNSIRTSSFVANGFTHDVLWSIKQHDPSLQAHSASYRPLEVVWFAINAQLFGVNHPAPWHLMKILLQVVAVLLCFRVAQLLTGEVVVALVAAAIFGIMPAHIEPVVWVSAIPEPLSTVFELAALIFLIQRKPGWSRGLMLSVLFFAFAILTHESAIFFPVIAFAYVMIFEAGSADTRPVRTASINAHIVRALTVCVPFLFVILVYAFARMHVLGDHAFGMPHTYTQAQMHGVVEAEPLRGAAQIAMTIPMVLLTYLGILAIPGLANPFHSIEWTTQLDPQVFIAWAALIVLALIAMVFASRSSRRKVYLFCAIWSLVTIAPALKINSLWWLNQDRYVYAPSFGWSLALALAIFEISTVGARARLAVGVATALLLLSYGVATIRGQRYWYDNLSYYSRAVQVKPNDPYYHLAVGNLLEDAKDPEGAVKQLEIAESLEPEDQYLHLRLAQTYMKLGRIKDFQREYNAFENSGASVIKSVHVGPDGKPDGKPDEQSAAAPQTPSAVAH
ncbi:hypothetical protein, partial [Candidatus Binatus sp.]|uniref:tetratricopeptide repeat protein n=1 Tax=Candidatus Binatus sp. TaxID=2811406 RepID=UPI003CC54BC3